MCKKGSDLSGKEKHAKSKSKAANSLLGTLKQTKNFYYT